MTLYVNKVEVDDRLKLDNNNKSKFSADIPAQSLSVMVQNILTNCAIKKRFRASQSLKLVALGGVWKTGSSDLLY